MKNVLAIHDISCVGRCSLTVALPIISGLGSTCTGLPTALLSTHTGGFTGFTCLDLTDEMQKIIKAWEPLNLKFDSIYSGFMASVLQINIVKNAIDYYRTPDMVSVIDPVMADYGKLYSIFDDKFVEEMKTLVPYADVLIPNITEAALLTGIEYKVGPYCEDYINTLIASLKKLGAKNVVLTGVYFKNGELGAAIGTADGKIEHYLSKKISGDYHGTGDVFGSVLTASLMNGNPLAAAARQAVEFVVESILASDPAADRKYGVDFETVLAKKYRVM